MNAFLRHYLRIDARSLGLFRIALGLTLLTDLAQRFVHRAAFYSNEGVLPNHNHLFNLKNEGRFVWSLLHAFATPGEATVGLLLIAVVYGMFTLGIYTRVSHVLSLVGLVSLSARNLLAEGPGEPVALALLLATVFLPLGAAFSVDVIGARAKAATEMKPKELIEDFKLPSDKAVQAGRLPGFSPVSLAAAGTLGLVFAILYSTAHARVGSWNDGSALHKAMQVHLVASPLGFSLRNSPILGPLTHFVRIAPYATIGLALIPLFRGPLRLLAAACLAGYGLVFALLTQFSLYGYALASASLLLVSSDTWEAWAGRFEKRRTRTVIYDEDCGICFWLSRYLRRIDTRRQLIFLGNGSFQDGADQLAVRVSADGKRKEIRLPDALTPELLESTVVAIREDGSFALRGQAVSEVMRAVPGLSLLGWLLSLPGLSGLFEVFYKLFAPRRAAVSVSLGMSACGVPRPEPKQAVTETVEVAPATRLKNWLFSSVREGLAVFVLLALLLRADEVHSLGIGVKPTGVLESVTWWTRTTAQWSLLSPEPPTLSEGPVVDAMIKEGENIDSFTGRQPVMTLDQPFELGSMWAMYLPRVISDQRRGYQSAFKAYVLKRGPKFQLEEGRLIGADFYWLKRPVDGSSEVVNERVFRQGRGGGTFGAPGSGPPNLQQRLPMLKAPVDPEPETTPVPQRLTPGEELGE